MKRETSWRVFAGEYNDSTFEIKGTGEKTPSYVVTPLGARVNRLFIIGVLTDVENISDGGELLRAHVSDPTGIFTLYSGQYQQDATNALLNIEVPAFVAVVGKARTYEPEEGEMYVSIRPELVRGVKADARDRWIVETCMHTKERIGAFIEAKKMNQPNAYDLRKLGYSKDLSEGIVDALKNYDNTDLHKYLALVQESLHYLSPGEEKLPETKKQEKIEKTTKKEKIKKEDKIEKSDDIENTVLETIKEIEGDDGAAWNDIVKKCKKASLDEDSIEESLTSLMDKGLIYEPVLGTIKTT